MDNISLLSSFLKMIFALAIVLGLLIGVMYFIRNFMQRQAPSVDNQALINVLSSRYLGPKSSIVLVEVLDQIIVVGITGQQMTPLARIDDPLAIAKIKSQRSQPPASPFSGEKIARLLSMANLSAGKKTGKSAK
ncbi:MAG: flagellar biosynthetic protein FliO [Deltaproteobacteria bacterium HGW-Deltaproteobacteria-7]|jgi:flagellar biosynthetic protein FliO|nr:MAG: flagellar biosynthetic protein FliO [Deltaproteobacteria bacterium HGW-Deltaproteobacteria-7]PKN20786.1 MAG: flagellar biosynthetic protein FliO [Deltaproteobacteria bacterium HGW-Deltaproteobacteria-6]